MEVAVLTALFSFDLNFLSRRGVDFNPKLHKELTGIFFVKTAKIYKS